MRIRDHLPTGLWQQFVLTMIYHMRENFRWVKISPKPATFVLKDVVKSGENFLLVKISTYIYYDFLMKGMVSILI